MYILNEVETSHHLILIRLYFSLHVMQLIRIQTTEEYFYFPHLVVWDRYCACEILIANPVDWLFAACLEYFIFSRSTPFDINSVVFHFDDLNYGRRSQPYFF
jgi:hypothetical protein